jgi:hypothetical protein
MKEAKTDMINEITSWTNSKFLYTLRQKGLIKPLSMKEMSFNEVLENFPFFLYGRRVYTYSTGIYLYDNGEYVNINRKIAKAFKLGLLVQVDHPTRKTYAGLPTKILQINFEIEQP